MKKNRFTRKIRTVIYLGLFLFTGCTEKKSESNMHAMSELTISIGEQGDAFIARNAELISADKQPAGVNFYEVNWKTSNPGTVFFKNKDKNNKNDLTIEYALGVMGAQNNDFIEEGISEFNVHAGISKESDVLHDQARKKFFQILNSIKSAGWLPIISRSAPRLTPKDMFFYNSESKNTEDMSPDYLLNLDEWVSLVDNTSWSFYNHHVYLTVSFNRDSSRLDKNKEGAYLLTFHFKGESDFFRQKLDSADFRRWRKVLPDALLQAQMRRQKTESELKEKGFKINEDYIDPPAPAL